MQKANWPEYQKLFKSSRVLSIYLPLNLPLLTKKTSKNMRKFEKIL